MANLPGKATGASLRVPPFCCSFHRSFGSSGRSLPARIQYTVHHLLDILFKQLYAWVMWPMHLCQSPCLQHLRLCHLPCIGVGATTFVLLPNRMKQKRHSTINRSVVVRSDTMHQCMQNNTAGEVPHPQRQKMLKISGDAVTSAIRGQSGGIGTVTNALYASRRSRLLGGQSSGMSRLLTTGNLQIALHVSMY